MSVPFTVAARLRSVRYAVNGVWLILKTQHNAWIHAGATLAAACAGFILSISKTDWCMLILSCAAVWTAEALNTALEYLADATTKKLDPLIGKAKDVAAGAVLITAISDVSTGDAPIFLIVTPRLRALNDGEE